MKSESHIFIAEISENDDFSANPFAIRFIATLQPSILRSPT